MEYNDENTMKKNRRDSITEQTYVLMPKHINGSGRLFGGQLMSWIDEIGGIVAWRHCKKSVVTAVVDHLVFKAGAKKNDVVVLIGHLTYVGNTSMEVRVDTYVEDEKGMRTMINRAYLVLVALDENGYKTKVPGLILETDFEKAEWDAALLRNELRKTRTEKGF